MLDMISIITFIAGLNPLVFLLIITKSHRDKVDFLFMYLIIGIVSIVIHILDYGLAVDPSMGFLDLQFLFNIVTNSIIQFGVYGALLITMGIKNGGKKEGQLLVAAGIFFILAQIFNLIYQGVLFVDPYEYDAMFYSIPASFFFFISYIYVCKFSARNKDGVRVLFAAFSMLNFFLPLIIFGISMIPSLFGFYYYFPF